MNISRKKPHKPLRGAAGAESRYIKLKSDLENDLFNKNWAEVDISHHIAKTPHYTSIDLFSGAGGLSCGLRQAGFKKLLSVEIDPDASATIRRNFPESKHYEGKIEDLNIHDILPDLKEVELHLLAGGPPCQGFSVAGFRKKSDPRNSIVNYFLGVVKEYRPWTVLIENVPVILTLDNGGFKELIFQELKDAGYEVSVRIHEAADFGVPQLRTRAIFFANRFGLPNLYPIPTNTRSNYVPIEDAIRDLADLPPDPVINHEWTKHKAAMEERISKVRPGGSLYETFRDAWKRQHMGVPSMAIKENHGGTHIHPWKDRVISAREMARLQTFPDDFIFCGTMKRAMWQIGNAVPVRLGEVLGLAIRQTLNKCKKQM